MKTYKLKLSDVNKKNRTKVQTDPPRNETCSLTGRLAKQNLNGHMCVIVYCFKMAEHEIATKRCIIVFSKVYELIDQETGFGNEEIIREVMAARCSKDPEHSFGAWYDVGLCIMTLHEDKYILHTISCRVRT
jgi:hypothetical protein